MIEEGKFIYDDAIQDHVDGRIQHKKFLAILENKDCHECPLHKHWGIQEEDGGSMCYVLHKLKVEEVTE